MSQLAETYAHLARSAADVFAVARSAVIAPATAVTTLTGRLSSHFNRPASASSHPSRVTSVTWGIAFVDATVHGGTVRFIATHLEGFSVTAQMLQAKELIARANSGGLPLMLAGDLNTDPNDNKAPLPSHSWHIPVADECDSAVASSIHGR